MFLAWMPKSSPQGSNRGVLRNNHPAIDCVRLGFTPVRWVAVSSGKLRQKPQIVFKEQANIIYAITQHGKPLHAHTEGIAGVFFRIDTDVPEYSRMHHAAAQHLQPSRIAADTTTFPVAHHTLDIHLCGRLGEGKIGGPKPQPQIPLEETL